MMPRGWRHSIPLQAALAALGLSIAATAWAFVQAVRVEPIPNPPATAIASLETIRRGIKRPAPDLQAVVDNNVFSIDRSAPAAPYRMPGDPDPNARVAPQPERPILLGTAIATDTRHFATMQLRDGTTKLVRVGDRIGEWVVRAIERGKVVLVSTGGVRAEVTVTKPGI